MPEAIPERSVVIRSLVLAFPLTILLAPLVFFLTEQELGRFNAMSNIYCVVLSVLLLLFLAFYTLMAARQRRKAGIPILQFSLRRLLVGIVLVALYLYPNATPKEYAAYVPPSATDVVNCVFQYGWPLTYASKATMVSGVTIQDFRLGALVFDIVLVLLALFFVLTVRTISARKEAGSL
jgi:hypothetical protein